MHTIKKNISEIRTIVNINMWLSMILISSMLTLNFGAYMELHKLKTQVLNINFERKVAIDTVFLSFEKTVSKKPVTKNRVEKKIKEWGAYKLNEDSINNGVKVRATVYNAVEEQCDSDPSHTAFMFKLDLKNPFKHKIIAVSRDLETHFPNNTKVRIEGTNYDGIYTVKDRMHSKCRRQIDILINNNMPLGNWHNAKIYKM